jgi:hypothetical protein
LYVCTLVAVVAVSNKKVLCLDCNLLVILFPISNVFLPSFVSLSCIQWKDIPGFNAYVHFMRGFVEGQWNLP